jgi:hypothetical protein
MVGQPEMLRMGEAATDHQAEKRVHLVIDRALDVQEAVRFLNPRQSVEP